MDSYPELGVQKADVDINNNPSLIASSAIDKLWKQMVGDSNLTSEFNQAWICREFKLGDELTQYNYKQHSAVNGGVVYLICRGKVRLLAFDRSLKKKFRFNYSIQIKFLEEIMHFAVIFKNIELLHLVGEL